MTVGEMLARISSAELTEWVAFYEWENEQIAKDERGRKRQR